MPILPGVDTAPANQAQDLQAAVQKPAAGSAEPSRRPAQVASPSQVEGARTGFRLTKPSKENSS